MCIWKSFLSRSLSRSRENEAISNESDKMGCVLCKNDVSGTEVVIIISDANGTVIKDFRKKGKSIKKIVFVLPVIVVTNEDNEETVVYKPDENAEPKVEKILVNS